jgi:hypothetical protein
VEIRTPDLPATITAAAQQRRENQMFDSPRSILRSAFRRRINGRTYDSLANASDPTLRDIGPIRDHIGRMRLRLDQR